jgi:putative transposase
MPHHITQRGNMRENVFFEEQDFSLYKKLLIQYATKYGLSIWAYCLMTNHIHLVAVPSNEKSMGFALRDTHQTYALCVNRRLSRTGHMWQGRYYSTVMDEYHLWTAVRYVENNPVRAGMAAKAEDYPHSSARAYCGKTNDPLLSGDFSTKQITGNWSRWLQRDDAIAEQTLRAGTRTGRPCGSNTFLERLESLLGRPVKKRAPGRKKMVEN